MTTQEKRKQKLWLFLPLLILPFLALAFYVLGGGKSDVTGVGGNAAGLGINTALPGAKLQRDSKTDKLSLYDRAQRDSAADRSHSAAGAFAALGWDTAGLRKPTAGVPALNSAAVSEAQIKTKLAEINAQIHAPQPATQPVLSSQQQDAQAAQMARLEAVIRQKEQGGAPSPEMQQLNTMLDKIQQIQNPGLVQERLKKEAATDKVKPDSAFKAIPALIDGNQKVLNGGVVRLKLKDSITIKGIRYPAGQLLSGSCTVTNQRLLLEIHNVRMGTSIIPVNLTVFSLDGMAGIPAPEAELGEAAGDGANGALENMQFLSADYSVGTQAATAGISAAKGLLGRKVRRIRVKLHGGQTVLLRVNRS